MPRNANKASINWNDDRKLCLLKVVQQLGGHLIGGSGVTRKWSEINKMLFEQDIFKEYANSFGEKEHRKVKDMYEKTMKAIKHMMLQGNLSRFDGEISPLYQCAQEMIEEAEAAEDEKSFKKSKNCKINQQWKRMRRQPYKSLSKENILTAR
jgi:hypothetical protein